jgi:AraC-like DNA-binding protein
VIKVMLKFSAFKSFKEDGSMRGAFYRKSLVITLIIACLPTATVGLLLYLFGIPKIQSEFNLINQQQQEKAARRINDTISSLELLASQWAYNPSFDNRLRDIDLRDQFAVTQNLYRTLSVMKGSNPLIGQVNLYLQHAHAVISDDRGVSSIASDEFRSGLYDSLIHSNKSIFWTNVASDRETTNGWSEMALVLKLPDGGDGQTYGLLIVYLNATVMDQLIGEMASGTQGASLLMENNGQLIANGHADLRKTSNFDIALRNMIVLSDKQPHSLLFKWNEETYSVTYRAFSRLGSQWIYASAVPLAQLTTPVLLLSRIIIGTSCLVLLVAALFSWQASLRLYRPIRRLIGMLGVNLETSDDDPHHDEFQYIEHRWQHLSRESQVLQVKLEQQLPSLRQGFLLQLVQGHLIVLSEAELRDRMIQYGWDILHKSFSVLMVQLSGNLDDSGKFSDGDEQFVTFSAGHIAEEIASTRCRHVDLINFQDMSFGMMLLYPSSQTDEQVKGELIQLANQLTNTLSSMMRMDVTISLGQRSSSVRRLPEVFDETRQALRYRDLNLSCQVLDTEVLMPNGRQAVIYPFEYDKQIIQSIRMGLEDEAIAYIGKFMEDLQSRSGEELPVRQALVQLLGNIQFAIMQSGYNPHEIYGDISLIDQFNRLHKPKLMVDWLQNHVIRPYIHAMVQTTDIQKKLLVEKVIHLLNETYMNDISMEYCADLCGTYPQRLSIAFKQVTAINFIDYLTRLRLDKSMAMLADSDIKINDIAERVGYQPSYFNRLFKKHTGMTPGQYREHYHDKHA